VAKKVGLQAHRIGRPPEAGGKFGIDLTDRIPRLDESPADVEEDGVNPGPAFWSLQVDQTPHLFVLLFCAVNTFGTFQLAKLPT
jgi:hypothetical protein